MNFSYRAYLPNGSVEVGEVEASGKQDAMRRLAGQGRAVFALKKTETKPARSASTRKRALNFVRPSRRFNIDRLFADLTLLTSAGLNVSQALRSMHTTEIAGEQRIVIGKLLHLMSTGMSASASLETLDQIPAECIGLVASGESAGRLPEVFRALTQHYEARAKLKSELLNALAYPVFLAILMILAVLVITFALVPAIEPIFVNADQAPPFIVAVLSSLRHSLTTHAFTLFLLGTAIPLFVLFLPKQRALIRGYVLRTITQVPLIGTIITKTALARYLSSLALLLINGIPMSKALELAASSVSVADFHVKLLAVRDRVVAGEPLPKALNMSALFDDRVISLIAVGDAANRLGIVAERAAQILEKEAQATTARCIAVLTPAMTILLGLLIGGLIVSVMTALLSLNEIAIQ